MGDEEPIGIGGETAAEIGSARLALALANQDLLGVGQALRHDYVVAPILRSADGEPQILVTTSMDPAERQFVLPLYSSAHTMQLAFPEAEKTEFALRQGASLMDVLEANGRVIQWVAFDQAGPNPLWATADDVRNSLTPRLGDDDVAWAASAGTSLDLEQIGDPGAPHPTALTLSAPSTWVSIELASESDRIDGAARAARARTPHRRQALWRAETQERLLSTIETAAGRGARTVIVAAPTDELEIVVHWHEIGPAFGGTSHLTRMSSGWSQHETRTHTLQTGRAISHDVEGGVDYWLEFPDGRGLCLLEFRGDEARALAPSLVASAAWTPS